MYCPPAGKIVREQCLIVRHPPARKEKWRGRSRRSPDVSRAVSRTQPREIEITLFAARQEPAPLEKPPAIKIGGPDRRPCTTKFLPPLPSRGEGATLRQSRGEGFCSSLVARHLSLFFRGEGAV